MGRASFGGGTHAVHERRRPVARVRREQFALVRRRVIHPPQAGGRPIRQRELDRTLRQQGGGLLDARGPGGYQRERPARGGQRGDGPVRRQDELITGDGGSVEGDFECLPVAAGDEAPLPDAGGVEAGERQAGVEQHGEMVLRAPGRDRQANFCAHRLLPGGGGQLGLDLHEVRIALRWGKRGRVVKNQLHALRAAEAGRQPPSLGRHLRHLAAGRPAAADFRPQVCPRQGQRHQGGRGRRHDPRQTGARGHGSGRQAQRDADPVPTGRADPQRAVRSQRGRRAVEHHGVDALLLESERHADPALAERLEVERGVDGERVAVESRVITRRAQRVAGTARRRRGRRRLAVAFGGVPQQEEAFVGQIVPRRFLGGDGLGGVVGHDHQFR